MKNIKILDCTLRDGGYINDWKFGNKTIKQIVDNLEDANIDIIETGFIRNVPYDNECSVFANVDQIKRVISPKKENVLYAAMIEQHNYFANMIAPYDGESIDIVRLTFRKNEWNAAKETIVELMDKGYKVCVQPVGTVSYDDKSLLDLIAEINILKPFAFYLVDTLGVMYQHDMRRLFYLIDNNLSIDVSLGFHSHNNLQMSFSNAQEMIRLNHRRNIIIDASCYGMGRGVGNLNTELLSDYINKNFEYRYSLIPLLNIVDKYLMPIYAEHRWGYDLPYFLSSISKCHPNYASFLMKKETLSVEKIEKILTLIPLDSRNEFNKELIENLYLNLQNFEIDDSLALKGMDFKEKDILVIGSGNSIKTHYNDIVSKTKSCIKISVNFISDMYHVDYVFVSNEKRLFFINDNTNVPVIATSNLKNQIKQATFFNYSSLLGEGESADNSGSMLIRLLKKLGVRKVYIAGFDGFDSESNNNYVIKSFRKSLDFDSATRKNNSISIQLRNALSGVDYEFITPTKYKINNI